MPEENVEHWLTTIDNPYNPFTQFEEWYQFDTINGYNSLNYVDRVANVTDKMNEEEKQNEIERAILQIVNEDPLNVFIRTTNKAL